MANIDPPKKQLQVRPGESPWLAATRELVRNPDSPASLQIMSAVSKAVAPRERAAAQVISALADQLLSAGAAQAAAVAAAILHWEREFGEAMPAAVLAALKRDANERIERRRRQPPEMAAIIANCPSTADTGYELGVHLEGLLGTWHRLWAIVRMSHRLGHDIALDEGVSVVRAQFEELLGRPMTGAEWDALATPAVAHAEAFPNSLRR